MGAILQGWLFVRLQGMWLIGKQVVTLSGSERRLSPVYQVNPSAGLVPTAQGPTLNISHTVTPVAWLGSIKTLLLPERCEIEVDCAELTTNEQKRLFTEINQCEELLKALRAAEAGIAIAKPGEVPPLPPQLRAVK